MRNSGSFREEVEGECASLAWLVSGRARLAGVRQITEMLPGGHWDSTDSLKIFTYNNKRLKIFVCESSAQW